MDAFLGQWLTLVAVFAVALASPGPDFVMAIQNSLLHGRRAGILTAIGFGGGICVHVAYTLVGLATLIAKSIVLFTILKVIGAAYLFYLGFKAIRSTGWHDRINAVSSSSAAKWDRDALRDGFITNALNPKATLLFLALFTQLLRPDMPVWQQMTLGGTCVVMTIIWFSIVAVFMTTPTIRQAFARFSKWVDRLCGAVFIGLGLKLLAARVTP